MGKKRKATEMTPEQQNSPPSPAEQSEAEAETETESASSSTSFASSDGTDSDAEASAPESPLSQDLVDVTIEFFDPKPDDFHGTKALLQTLLDDVEWDINGFVEQFLAQTTVGTVVKTAEDEGPIGIISVFNVGRYQKNKCMKDVYKFLKRGAGDNPEVKQLERFWKTNASEVGFLVSERVLNLPMDFVPGLYGGLFEEISWATEDELTEELRNSFKLKYLLVLTKVFEDCSTPGGSEIKKQQEAESEHAENLIFVKPEDELLLKLSSWSFTFPSKSEAAAVHQSKDMKQLRLVMGIDSKKMETFQSRLKDMAETEM